ncbi:hydrogenase nickel incorporation protein HypB [bacterium]|nr:hydrogenase nickel incorporation protein HypB [bacterium]
MEVVVTQDILKANDSIAEQNLAAFDEAGVYTVNVLGSPGSGKTTLLEKLAEKLNNRVKAAVIEGDLATSKDAERIEKLGWPTIQINTGGGCHLEANMVSSAMKNLPLDTSNLLFIENVGNLVCTASHKLGERLRIVVLSATEGDDKVSKYPPMFQKTNALIMNKADLLPYTDFDVDRMEEDARRLNPDVEIFKVSARTGEGIAEVADWLVAKRETWFASR